MEFWLHERHTEGYEVSWKFTKTLYTGRSEYQELAVIETKELGRALVLDGIIQTTLKDEFIYHEMIAHPALFTHPNPRRVLVIGGGDGGTVREILKHKRVQQIDLVELDGQVIWASREYLPKISCGLNDQRVKIYIEDGMQFIKTKADYYDVVIVDSPDPIGQAENLYGSDFYQDIYKALKEDGIMTAQTESPHFNSSLLARVNKSLSQLYPVTRTYLTTVPSYIGGFWSYTIGSKKYDPLHTVIDTIGLKDLSLRYFNPEIHKASFALPNFIRELMG